MADRERLSNSGTESQTVRAKHILPFLFSQVSKVQGPAAASLANQDRGGLASRSTPGLPPDPPKDINSESTKE